MYINLNLNPFHRRADDCVIRGIAKLLDKTWEEVYADICLEGLRYYDMPSANHVWGSYLKKKGYEENLTRNDLDTVNVLTNTIKNIDKLTMSEQGSFYGMGDWTANGSYSNGMPMNYSGRRGRGYSHEADDPEYRMRREMY